MFETSRDKFVLLEIHYENLELKRGKSRLKKEVWRSVSELSILELVDHSGVRMFLTPTPRPVEAGLLIIAGLEQPINQILPPGEKEFRFYAHGGNCLRYLPPGGVNLFYVLLHSHVHGKKMRVHHYRQGLQLPDFAVDDNYNFYYQVGSVPVPVQYDKVVNKYFVLEFPPNGPATSHTAGRRGRFGDRLRYEQGKQDCFCKLHSFYVFGARTRFRNVL